MQGTSFALSILCSAIAACVSCTSSKRIAYFQDISDSLRFRATSLEVAKFQDPEIQPGDILQITMQRFNSLDDSDFIRTRSQESTDPNATKVSEFLVDRLGHITVPLIGILRVAGLTSSAAKDTIQAKLGRFFQDPIINVRISNFTITVLGEVSRPASYVLAKEKTSVLDALGIAGDMTIYGKRDNVLLIRNASANKEAVRLDLSSSSVMRSPYFYLKQGDVLYVEPNKSKINSLDATKTRNYALLASGLSVLIVLISRFNF
jgi:polysaccharide export outer membrane protein